MTYPDFILALPALDVPFPEDLVTTHAIRSDRGLVVYFSVHKDMEVPEHSHGAQWGSLFHGEIELTVAGETRTCRPRRHLGHSRRNAPFGETQGRKPAHGRLRRARPLPAQIARSAPPRGQSSGKKSPAILSPSR